MTIPGPGGAEPLYLVGIGPVRPGLADVEAALAGIPEDGAAGADAQPAELSRAAGGLCSAGRGRAHPLRPDRPALLRPLVLVGRDRGGEDRGRRVGKQGYGAEGNRLFVTCGLGFSVVPVRINAPPQLVFFDLLPGEG